MLLFDVFDVIDENNLYIIFMMMMMTAIIIYFLYLLYYFSMSHYTTYMSFMIMNLLCHLIKIHVGEYIYLFDTHSYHKAHHIR